jgi:hypothetical protein
MLALVPVPLCRLVLGVAPALAGPPLLLLLLLLFGRGRGVRWLLVLVL